MTESGETATIKTTHQHENKIGRQPQLTPDFI